MGQGDQGRRHQAPVTLAYRLCPKCGHERTAEDRGDAGECPACGLIFAKYLRSRFAAAPPQSAEGAASGTPLPARARDFLLHVPDSVSASEVYARAALLLGLVVYGVRLAAMDIPSWEMSSSLMHLPMVPIHEFGHLLLRPFGEFLHLLGGSLFQAGLPLAFGVIFLVRRRDPFAAAVMLWWSAVAVMDIAPYVYDAQAPQHVLLTGRTGETGAHDFIDVLGDLGLLTRAQSVGYAVHRGGMAMLGAAFLWAGWIVWLQHGRKG